MRDSRIRGGSAGAPAGQEETPREPRGPSAARERRRWMDFRRAVREARAAGAFALRANGVKVWLQQPLAAPQSKTTVEGAATQQDARQEAQPSARKRRSATRMHEFVLRKRYQQLATCRLRLSLLRAMRKLRWQRTQGVWTQWMRERSRAEAAVPMLLEPSEQSAPSSAPPKHKRRAEERSPGMAGPASGADTTSPNITGGKQPRGITCAAAAGGDSGAPSSIDPRSMRMPELKKELTRRGLDATGLKSEMVARLEAHPPSPPRPLRERADMMHAARAWLAR